MIRLRWWEVRHACEPSTDRPEGPCHFLPDGGGIETCHSTRCWDLRYPPLVPYGTLRPATADHHEPLQPYKPAIQDVSGEALGGL